MYDFFFWSGIVAWFCAALAGILVVADAVIEWLVSHVWTKKEFLAFVADRLRKRREARTGQIPAG